MTLTSIKKYISESIENTGLYVESNYIFISIVAVFGFPIFYYVWSALFPQTYESLAIRLVGAVIFFPLLLIKRWPAQLMPYFKYYSLVLLLYIIVFFFFMLIKNEHSEIWTLSTVCGVFLFVILTDEWFIASVLFTLGVAIACGLAVITSNDELLLIKYEHSPIYLFLIIGGSMFNYRKNIILQEKYKMLKAFGSTINQNMGTSLVKIKTAIEDITGNIDISKKYTEKNILGLLAEKLQQTNEDLNRVQNELVKSEKMAALGRAVARIAHELNTPIGSARISAENIRDETKSFLQEFETANKEEVQKLVAQYQTDMDKMGEGLFESVNRAAELVRDFKTISNDQINIEKKEFELLEYLQGSIRMLKAPLERQNITVKFHGEKIILHSDASLFHHIITNLTTNVMKYAYDEKGGHIDIALESTEDEITISFTDYGKGIPEEDIPKVFDAFFTTGGGKGGTGLGLDIVYRNVTNHLKGTITCKSTEGVSTIFTLTIPKNH